MSDYISDVFGDSGLFASRFPGYERRDGQVALARMVDEAMTSGRHALGEGPCGTGKSAAYCVPAIYHAHHSQATTVIVTANIALQEQLVGKDLPLLVDLLPWDFKFTLLKGRNNYLCLNRIEESEEHGEFRVLLKDEQRQINDVLAWLKRTETGDVSELPFVPSPKVWSRFSAGIDDCKHDDCEFRNECFAQRTRARAKEADIIVTNYHMLFAHLAVRMQTGKNLVLPPFDYLVLDEAHEAADIAREFFGFTVSEYSFLPLAAVAEDYGDKELACQIRAEVGRLFAELAKHARSSKYKRRLTTKGVTTVTELEQATSLLIMFALNRATDSTLCERDRCQLNRAAERTRRVMSRLKEGLDQSDAAKIYWLELDAKGRARLRAKLLDVSSLLRAELFERCASVTLTSATLTTSGSFEFIRGQLGVPNDALETIAPSPFDFESQALLVVPEGISDPRTPEFVDAAAEAFRRVIELCDAHLGPFHFVPQSQRRL